MLIKDHHSVAQVVLPTTELASDLAFFTAVVGFRLKAIYPSDDPAVAILQGYGLEIRLDRSARSSGQTLILPPGTVVPLTDDSADNWERVSEDLQIATAPNGVVIEVPAEVPELSIPEPTREFAVRRLSDGVSWVIGRAGMHYRDLVPDRLGGSIIASHIRIPEGGPVPDMVHYHTVGFQLIYCYRGWVRLVYEDQGPPFILKAGDCVTQPPGIRHQVLEASDELQVIEIAVPAEHMTTIDHELTLPTPHHDPHRQFGDQVFCRYASCDAHWAAWYQSGFIYSETGVEQCSSGAASVHIAKSASLASGSGVTNSTEHQAADAVAGADSGADLGEPSYQHQDDILFAFVTEGELNLRVANESPVTLVAGDAFVIPPATDFRYDASESTEMIEVRILSSD